MRPQTIVYRRRLYLLARVIVQRHYRQELTLARVAQALASSPRQLQRAYAQFGANTFREDLLARRMNVAADLLVQQRSIRVADVARLVGYRQPPHFARAFRARYGVPPAQFRRCALQARSGAAAPAQFRQRTLHARSGAVPAAQSSERMRDRLCVCLDDGGVGVLRTDVGEREVRGGVG